MMNVAGLLKKGWMLALAAVPCVYAQPTHTDMIRVDQFGYPPDAPKVAVIADPVYGWNSAESYTPGAVLELRRQDANGGETVVFSAAPLPWSNGDVHGQSGDRVWWFDFSGVTEVGSYHIHDPANNSVSDSFRIDPQVYQSVLRETVRMFFYQRVGFAKDTPYAATHWVDAASHLQDAHCRSVWDQNNVGLEKDLSGGWYDAGDFNKYTEWTARVVMELLLAYQQRPDVFTDDYGIPESGNGIPDLLDEVKWGLDWLLRMQEENGALLGKVSVLGHNSASPPSADLHPRFYGPVSTEATAAGAAAFALGATVYRDIGLLEYADTLRAAATSAWQWATSNPDVQYDNSGFDSASPHRDAYGRLMNRLKAAVMLFEHTGDPAYRDFVDAHYMQAQPIQWWYFYPFEAELQKALVQYASLSNATPSVAQTIRQRVQSSLNGEEFLPAWQGGVDAYRAPMKDQDYTWGSNRAKAQMGSIFLQLDRLGLAPEQSATRREAALGYLHYLHGVNPMAIVYLSNMYPVGATRSVNTLYHHWFIAGSDWDDVRHSPRGGPAPGYLVGGPNQYYGGTVSAIRDQPVQKAYLDWNGGWPENSWEITEPAIYYQSAYIHLLSALIPVLNAEEELLIINPRPHPAGIAYGFEFSFERQPETPYAVEYTDHLLTPVWHTLSNIVADAETGLLSIIDPPPLPRQRFYRVLRQSF